MPRWGSRTTSCTGIRFPGRGWRCAVPGDVRIDKLEIIRECDAIFIGQLKEHDWYDKVWQAYAALMPVKTVGVKGDERSYEWAISLRAVVSEDAMTADWVELPYHILRETSHRILNEVQGGQPRALRHLDQAAGEHRVGVGGTDGGCIGGMVRGPGALHNRGGIVIDRRLDGV